MTWLVLSIRTHMSAFPHRAVLLTVLLQSKGNMLVHFQAGDSPLQLPPKPLETSGKSRSNPLLFVLRLLLGSTAGFYYFVLPVYMWIKDRVWPRSMPGF